MATPRTRKAAGDGNIDVMMSEILVALDHIRDHMPNGELKDIQQRIKTIESSQVDVKEELRSIKKQLLDPEDGLVVRVNKNTEYRVSKQDDEDYYDTIIQEHKELVSWKNGVTKALWIIFTAIAGIIAKLFLGSGN
jgi:hypothetical protein